MPQIKRWEIWGVIVSIIVGSFFHFIFDWSRHNSVVAIFAAVNESTWEHLKLAFWPTFIFAAIEWFIWGRAKANFCLASLAKLAISSFIIIILFYGWLLFFPDNLIWDISIFVVAIIVAYFVSCQILRKEKGFKLESISTALIIAFVVIFSLFSYFPPKIFLMRDPVSGGFGIISKVETTTTQVAAVLTEPTSQPVADSKPEPPMVDGMKKYDGENFNFLYPASINGLNMERRTWQDLPLAEYAGIYNDPPDGSRHFTFSIYELGFKIDNEMFYNSINEKKIDPNISLAEFKAMSNSLSEILKVKKLSDRSLLVFSYTNYECNPDAQILIISPVQNSQLYSNMNVRVSPDELLNLPPDETGDQCSINLAAFQNMIDNIVSGTASSDVMDALALGQKMAESASGTE